MDSPVTPAAAPTGAAIVALAAAHVGESYHLGVFVPKDNARWTGPWDCAEFASWLVFQVSSTLYGCQHDNGDPSTAVAYTGYWTRDARSIGHLISLDDAAATPGAFVLRIPPPGSIGHVVVSDGARGTLEAHSSKDGVIRSTLANRRWDLGVLIPGVAYSQNAAPVRVVAPAATIYRLTTPVMVAPQVKTIQTALAALGFNPGILDSQFGPHTQAAVIAFQATRGLAADGEVGPATAAALGISL